MDLFSILGQEIPKRYLSTILKTGNFSHFYLFVGPPGVGKGKMAEEFAALISCDEKDTLCKKRIEENIHPNIKVLEEKTIKIQDIKDIQKEICLSSLNGKKKVVIIKDAERLTLEAANALLKTLEEPPEDTIFILTSSWVYTLPLTIISRAQIVRFSSLSFDIVYTLWKEKFKRKTPLPVYDGTMHFIDTMDIREELFSLFQSITSDRERKRVYKFFNYGMEKRGKLKDLRSDLLEIWFSFLRDIYLSENNGIINLYKKKEFDLFRDKFRHIEVSYLFESLSFLEKGIIFNINFIIWWEYLILSTYDILFGG